MGERHISAKRAAAPVVRPAPAAAVATPKRQNDGADPCAVPETLEHSYRHSVAAISILPPGGRPLPASESAFYGLRLGADFGGVRLHTGPRAEDTTRSVNALAYTVGSNVVLSNEVANEGSMARRRTLAHELTHVLQQRSMPGNILQRRCPGRGRPPVRDVLLRAIALGRLSVRQLRRRYDHIVAAMQRVERWCRYDPRLTTMQMRAGEIGEDFARRNAPALARRGMAGRTFTLQAADRMKRFFIANVRSRSPLACINTVREGLSSLYGSQQSALVMSPRNTMEMTMARLQVHGLAGRVTTIHMLDSRGRVIPRGSNRAVHSLQTSVWSTIMTMVGNDREYSAFGISLADGHHSATLTVDNRNMRGRPLIRWSDQTGNHDDGWEAMGSEASGHPRTFRAGSNRGLDEYILYAMQEFTQGGSSYPVIRLWRINRR